MQEFLERQKDRDERKLDKKKVKKEKVKAAAAYNAISKGDGDILVSPSYVVKTTLYPFYIFAYLQIEVDVTGYEGKIKDIHP